MQGTAADIIKRAMVSVQNWLNDDGSACKMIMQVHDELVFEVDHEQVERCRDAISEKMVSAAELNVQLEVDAGIGNNWHEAH
ncbi:MAG: DNA polymerase-1 [Planctomycetota bacterium]|jgi:DNA polymerase-1